MNIKEHLIYKRLKQVKDMPHDLSTLDPIVVKALYHQNKSNKEHIIQNLCDNLKTSFATMKHCMDQTGIHGDYSDMPEFKTANKTYNQIKELGIELNNVDTYAKETITKHISELTTDLSKTK